MPLSQSQAAARRKLLEAARLAVRTRQDCDARLPGGFFLTDPRRTPDPVRIAENMPAGLGVIYRHFGSTDRFGIARRLAAVCRRRKLVLLIAADPALALSVQADGVHWPMRQLGMRRVRRRHWIETCSAHSRSDLVRAARMGVDAALLSAVFASDSPSAPSPLGVLKTARIGARLPVYALGGITPGNAGRAVTRMAGWAAISAVAEAWD